MIPPEQLLQAYATGIFPMYSSEVGKVQWYSADPRGIIDLTDYHISKRLMRYIRNSDYIVTFDQSFDKVIKSCAQEHKDEGIWISNEIIQSYTNLFNLGFAHSVEISSGSKLIAGLYGVALRGAFFGESMFNLNEYPNTSKIALYYLIQHLVKREFLLLDIQMITSTTEQFGAISISKNDYLTRLNVALSQERTF